MPADDGTKPKWGCDCAEGECNPPPPVPESPCYRSGASVQIIGAFLVAVVIVSVGAILGLRFLQDASKW